MIFLIPFFLSTIIYIYSFINLGNTVFRINSDNQIKSNYTILFTEGFIGPARSFYLSTIYNNTGLEYLKHQLFMFSNPWFTYSFVFSLFYLIKYIYYKLKNYSNNKLINNKNI